MDTATMTVRDDGSHLTVLIDRGRGWEVLGTTPTRRGAQVAAARDAGMVNALTFASGLIEFYQRIYAVTVI